MRVREDTLQEAKCIHNIPCQIKGSVWCIIQITGGDYKDILQNHRHPFSVLYKHIQEDQEDRASDTQFPWKTSGLCYRFHRLQDHYQGWLLRNKMEETKERIIQDSCCNINTWCFSDLIFYHRWLCVWCKARKRTAEACKGKDQKDICRQGLWFEGNIQWILFQRGNPAKEKYIIKKEGLTFKIEDSEAD